jgi:hypothetical protein
MGLLSSLFGNSDPNADPSMQSQYSDIPFGMRLALASQAAVALDQGKQADIAGQMGVLAQLQQTAVERRKAAADLAKKQALAGKLADKLESTNPELAAALRADPSLIDNYMTNKMSQDTWKSQYDIQNADKIKQDQVNFEQQKALAEAQQKAEQDRQLAVKAAEIEAERAKQDAALAPGRALLGLPSGAATAPMPVAPPAPTPGSPAAPSGFSVDQLEATKRFYNVQTDAEAAAILQKKSATAQEQPIPPPAPSTSWHADPWSPTAVQDTTNPVTLAIRQNSGKPWLTDAQAADVAFEIKSNRDPSPLLQKYSEEQAKTAAQDALLAQTARSMPRVQGPVDASGTGPVPMSAPGKPMMIPGTDTPYSGNYQQDFFSSMLKSPVSEADAARYGIAAATKDDLNKMFTTVTGEKPKKVITAEEPNAELYKELAKKQATSVMTNIDEGTKAANLGVEVNTLKKLVDKVPSGWTPGAVLSTLPGYSATSDLFTSSIQRIAPTLHQPGTGSQSDIEFAGVLSSLPKLYNTREGNKAIISIFEAKKDIMLERADISTKILNKEISPEEGQKQLMELNKRSVFTPEVKNMLDDAGVPAPDIVGGEGASSPISETAKAAGVDQPTWDAMTPEDKKLFE